MPKHPEENLLWRAFCIERMWEDKEYAHLMRESCRHDIRFYHNTFCWTLDPRKDPATIPWITYEYQDVLALLIVYNITESKNIKNRYRRWDVGCDKSRDMGVTWAVILTLDYMWRFWDHNSFRVISRIKESVDSTEDPDALFQRLDFNEERMPKALTVRGNHHSFTEGRGEMKIANRQTKSTIVGEASGPQAGRSGRSTGAFRDEEAFATNGEENTNSLIKTTRCQIRVSTPNGVNNSFALAMMNTGIDRIRLHWSLHPEKAMGLYSIKDGKVEIIDKAWHDEYERDHGKRYEFRMGPTHADPGSPWEHLRSPYFDGEEAGAESIGTIAQEEQISYLGTGSPFFRADKLVVHRLKNLRAPLHTGQLEEFLPADPNIDTVVDLDQRPDKCKLWFELIPGGRPPQNTTYSMGIDISAGNGSSDSTVSVADDTTKEKVFEFRSNGLTPDEFGEVCVWIYRWFETGLGAPYMAWDMGGHGLTFGTKVLRHDNIDMYYHMKKDKKKQKRSDRPGVPQNKEIKKELFEEYREALFSGWYKTPSKEAYEQLEQFVHDGSGGVTHQRSQVTSDPSARGEQHGDVATSEVILVRAMRERPEPMPVVQDIPDDCLYARWKAYEERNKATTKRWYD